MVRDLVAIFGVIAGFTYYVMTVRNAQRIRELTLKAQEQALETRQVQLFMQIFSRYQDPEFHHNAEHEMLQWEWNDYEHFMEKYGRENNPEAWKIFDSTLTWLDGVGILVKRGHIDPELVNDTLFRLIERGWEKFGPIIKETRRRGNSPRAFASFEYLYSVTKPLNEKLRNQSNG